jgi:hypothetical protein
MLPPAAGNTGKMPEERKEPPHDFANIPDIAWQYSQIQAQDNA